MKHLAKRCAKCKGRGWFSKKKWKPLLFVREWEMDMCTDCNGRGQERVDAVN